MGSASIWLRPWRESCGRWTGSERFLGTDVPSRLTLWPELSTIDMVEVSPSVAANAACGFVPLDFRKQPHRENHEETQECDDILDTVMPEHMLKIKRNGRHHDDHQR